MMMMNAVCLHAMIQYANIYSLSSKYRATFKKHILQQLGFFLITHGIMPPPPWYLPMPFLPEGQRLCYILKLSSL